MWSYQYAEEVMQLEYMILDVESFTSADRRGLLQGSEREIDTYIPCLYYFDKGPDASL